MRTGFLLPEFNEAGKVPAREFIDLNYGNIKAAINWRSDAHSY